tara:strand:- start:75 stop:494 length:420 start_codon:yes stop_codon:yes gene_type:complete
VRKASSFVNVKNTPGSISSTHLFSVSVIVVFDIIVAVAAAAVFSNFRLAFGTVVVVVVVVLVARNGGGFFDGGGVLTISTSEFDFLTNAGLSGFCELLFRPCLFTDSGGGGGGGYDCGSAFFFIVFFSTASSFADSFAS